MAATLLLILVVVLVAVGLVFGIITLITGSDPGLSPVDADGRARPLPNNRSLTESDLKTVRFDLTVRGYRMAQVDRVLRRTAYDVGYKDEMIAVLEAEVAALRDGRREDADLLRKARESAASPAASASAGSTAANSLGSGSLGSGSRGSGRAPAGTLIPPLPPSEEEPMAEDEFAPSVEEAESDEEPGSDQAYNRALDTGPGRLAPRTFYREPGPGRTAASHEADDDQADADDRLADDGSADDGSARFGDGAADAQNGPGDNAESSRG